MRKSDNITRLARVILAAFLTLVLCSCNEPTAEATTTDTGATDAAATVSDGASAIEGLFGGPSKGKTSGPSYTPPKDVWLSTAAISQDDASEWGTIDTSTLGWGYVTVAVVNSERIKFQVLCGDMSYNYDVPGDGTPVTCPLNMGDGYYTFRVMQNTSGNNYVELNAEGADVTIENEFYPFLMPNTICNYDAQSKCVKKAQELVKDAKNQGDALAAICNWVIANVTYDNDKAAKVVNATGYIPNPDETFSTGKGICFDFASLGAAMLRSQRIPARVMTGYVSPDEVYHSWICVYIDGTWQNVQFDVKSKTWSRVDLTFATGVNPGLVGDGKEYTDRYIY